MVNIRRFSTQMTPKMRFFKPKCVANFSHTSLNWINWMNHFKGKIKRSKLKSITVSPTMASECHWNCIKCECECECELINFHPWMYHNKGQLVTQTRPHIDCVRRSRSLSTTQIIFVHIQSKVVQSRLHGTHSMAAAAVIVVGAPVSTAFWFINECPINLWN